MRITSSLTEKFGLTVPIVQGPFGGGFSSVKLLAAVSNGGGLGSFGAHFLSPQGIRELDAEIKTQTDRPYAINLWVSDHDGSGLSPSPADFERSLKSLKPYFDELSLTLPKYPEKFGEKFSEQVEALLDAKPRVFSFVFGIPSAEILDRCRSSGIKTIGTATTLDEAVALDAAGVDAVVVSGFEAGGHRGAFLKPVEESLYGSMALIPTVVDRIRTPIIAAGGIADGRGIAAALVLGANGVQVGTAFLACEESNAPQGHKDWLFSPDSRHTQLTRVFSGRVARGRSIRLSQALSAKPDSILAYPAQSWVVGQIKKAAIEQRRWDLVAMWSGQAAPLLKHRRAGELLKSLMVETEQALARVQ